MNKWRKYMVGSYSHQRSFELALEQLKLLALIGKEDGFSISPVDGVYQSDDICPDDSELGQDLIRLTCELETALPLDEHPGSGGLALNLVHPSMFPATVGVTRVRPHTKLARTLYSSWTSDLGDLGLPVLREFEDGGPDAYGFGMSKRHQWLPAEFAVDIAGKVQINSYINNLHPAQFPELYPVLGKIFERGLPLLEQVLSDAINPHRYALRLIKDPSQFDMYEVDIPTHYDDYADSFQPLPVPLPDHFDGSQMHGYINRSVNLRNTRLQVIVKMSSIQLTADEWEYEGGVWHCEGMRNEHIVATLIHYYDFDNMDESTLKFRQGLTEPDYAQGDHRGVRDRYSLDSQSELNEELGCITAEGGRTVAFPNIYQHAVSPFELMNPETPGRRRILVFFLVDPLHRVLSTAQVPRQQREWVLGHTPVARGRGRGGGVGSCCSTLCYSPLTGV